MSMSKQGLLLTAVLSLHCGQSTASRGQSVTQPATDSASAEAKVTVKRADGTTCYGPESSVNVTHVRSRPPGITVTVTCNTAQKHWFALLDVPASFLATGTLRLPVQGGPRVRSTAIVETWSGSERANLRIASRGEATLDATGHTFRARLVGAGAEFDAELTGTFHINCYVAPELLARSTAAPVPVANGPERMQAAPGPVLDSGFQSEACSQYVAGIKPSK